jgi:hypothetical protein
MRIILKVSSSNEYCDGGCEFALVDLTPELAALALQRIAMLREQKSLDLDIDETYYWAYFAEYFSPWVNLAAAEKEVDPASLTFADMLDRFRIADNEVFTVPESFQLPSSQIAAVECQEMIARALCYRQHNSCNVAKSVMWHSCRQAALKENRFQPNAT